MLADVLIVVVKVVLALTWTLLLALFLTWVERKESAVMQDRIGANRASVFGLRLFGLFQPFADAIKMLFIAAVINGVLAPPLILIVLLLTGDPRVMGPATNSRPLAILGWIALVVMIVSMIGAFAL